VHPIGAVRRGEELVDDLGLLAVFPEPSAIAAALADDAGVDVLRVHEGLVEVAVGQARVSIHCSDVARTGAALIDLTGTPAHVEQLRLLAAAKGWRLDHRGLTLSADTPPIAASEEAIYRALGLPWIPPEIREGSDEIDAGRRSALPRLVEQSDIRGDLHMHTDASDGRDSVEAMVSAAAALGYGYIAITDHSPHSAASRNLSIESLSRQADEIAAVREQFPQLTVLHGCEVDILANGQLDFPDHVLEGLDIVLASLHEGEGHSPERLLSRYVAAMRHPLVTIITHPTNRRIPYRDAYDLDYDRLFGVAVETGTMVEVDGAPSHLDLNGEMARRAVAAGAMLTIDSDSHRADLLDCQMQLGVTTARRGWVERALVLNTGSIEDVRAVIEKKRSR
jgi:DNA polymerase (family 10)